MPELPEVELTRRRLELDLAGRRIERVEIRTLKLRLPIPIQLKAVLPGRTIRAVERRGKYLLLDCESGWLLIHLGMTGFLKFIPDPAPFGKHDHLDVVFTDGSVLRFHDPRKFGTVLWTTADPLTHSLLAGIGPEPLIAGFDGDYLFTVSRRRTVAVKLLIMNSAIVAGVGNIYANEALFAAGVDPSTNPAVTPPLETQLESGMKNTAPDCFSRVTARTVAIPREVTEYPDASLAKGTRRVVIAGSDGSVLRVYRSLVVGGVEGTASLTAEKILAQPVNEIVAVGTGDSPEAALRQLAVAHAPKLVTAASSSKAGKRLRVVATGYSADEPGAASNTRTGHRVQRGVIAVDPKVIPLGTRVYIPGYGWAIASDTGGLIKGNRIDLCFDTAQECERWGRRSVVVILLQ